ncbi:hypothetical protein VTO42DRAFT_8427 [Malbranchea cinnamomea]
MPVYHIVLFRFKQGVTQAQVDHFTLLAKGMVGKIPGLLELKTGPPLDITAHRAKGFNMGIVAILEKPADVKVYAEHPAHLELHNYRESLCEDTLAYDMEF